MGTVYLCEHSILRRKFALKVLRPELCGDRELVERFRNEAIAASGIGQDNVVDVVDFGAEEDGALYYVMEALEGRSLATVLREEGPLPVPRALALLEQVCRALAAAHGTGVVHRDVKPENVFVVRRDDVERAKVLDFGISLCPTERGGDRLTRAGAIIGTPEYMAPEQATGEGADHRADVYAVGVLAFEVLTGGLPIEGASPLATLVAAQTRAPDPPSRRRAGIPPAVDAIVLRALAKRPADRFPSMHELATEIARLRADLAGPGADLRQVGAPEKLASGAGRRWGETIAIAGAGERLTPRVTRPRRRRALLSGAAALAAVVAAALAGYWAGGDHPGAPERAHAAGVSVASPAPIETSPPAAPSAAPAAPSATPAATPSEPAPLVNARQGAAPRRVRAALPADPAVPGAPAGDLRDPYGAVGDLKPDPFE